MEAEVAQRRKIRVTRSVDSNERKGGDMYDRPAGSLVIAVNVSVLLMSKVRAEPVPDQATGIYSVGSCGHRSSTVLVNPTAALVFEDWQGETMVAPGTADWVDGSIDLTVGDGADEWTVPPLANLEECETLPGVFPTLFAESVAVFNLSGKLAKACDIANGVTRAVPCGRLKYSTSQMMVSSHRRR